MKSNINSKDVMFNKTALSSLDCAELLDIIAEIIAHDVIRKMESNLKEDSKCPKL